MSFQRFGKEHRVLVGFAAAEAGDLAHQTLGNDHLILGMLGNARSPLFSLLGEHGLQLAGARATVQTYHDEHPEADAEAAEKSAGERYEEDRAALASIGIDLDRVREAVRDRFGDDLAEGWAERSRRGRGGRESGGRGRGRHGHGHARRHGPERGRSGHRGGRNGWGEEPRGFGPGGPDGPGFGPEGRDHDGPWEPGRGRRGPRGRGGRPRFAPQTRHAFDVAMRIAHDRGDDALRPEYVLLGILEVGDPASAALIASASTDAAELKAAVEASLPEPVGAED